MLSFSRLLLAVFRCRRHRLLPAFQRRLPAFQRRLLPAFQRRLLPAFQRRRRGARLRCGKLLLLVRVRVPWLMCRRLVA